MAHNTIFDFQDPSALARYSLGMDGRFKATLNTHEWPAAFGVNGGIDGVMRQWLTAEFGKGLNLLEPPKSRVKARARRWGFYEAGYRHYVVFRDPTMAFAFKLRFG